MVFSNHVLQLILETLTPVFAAFQIELFFLLLLAFPEFFVGFQSVQSGLT